MSLSALAAYYDSDEEEAPEVPDTEQPSASALPVTSTSSTSSGTTSDTTTATAAATTDIGIKDIRNEVASMLWEGTNIPVASLKRGRRNLIEGYELLDQLDAAILTRKLQRSERHRIDSDNEEQNEGGRSASASASASTSTKSKDEISQDTFINMFLISGVNAREIFDNDRKYKDPMAVLLAKGKVDEYGTNFAPDVFSPPSFPLSDYYVSIQRQMASASMNIPTAAAEDPTSASTPPSSSTTSNGTSTAQQQQQGPTASISSEVAAAIAIATMRAGQSNSSNSASNINTSTTTTISNINGDNPMRKKSRWDAGGDN